MSKFSEAVQHLIATRDNALAFNDGDIDDGFDCPNDIANELLNDFLRAVDQVEKSWSNSEPAASCPDCGTPATEEAIGTVCHACKRGVIK